MTISCSITDICYCLAQPLINIWSDDLRREIESEYSMQLLTVNYYIKLGHLFFSALAKYTLANLELQLLLGQNKTALLYIIVVENIKQLIFYLMVKFKEQFKQTYFYSNLFVM